TPSSPSIRTSATRIPSDNVGIGWLGGATALTVVVAVEALLSGFRSDVADATVAVLLMTVPTGGPAGTFATSVDDALAPVASDALVAVIVPVLPTAGVVKVHPPGPVRETNVMTTGSVSVSETLAAASGPLLVTTRL